MTISASHIRVATVQELPLHSIVEFEMPFNASMTISDVSTLLRYDPDTGLFYWLVDVAKNVKAGAVAGSIKSLRSGKDGKTVRYRYIKVLGRDVVAARLAWLLHYGEWPLNRLRFKDADTLNLRIENLYESNGLPSIYDQKEPGQRAEYLRAHRAAHPLSWKNEHLKRHFGIELAEYSAMVAAQNNRCAICAKGETEVRNGSLKALSVDHNHTTGKVRALLCQACNKMIGLANEDVATLRAAIDYIEKHAALADNVVPLNKDTAQ